LAGSKKKNQNQDKQWQKITRCTSPAAAAATGFVNGITSFSIPTESTSLAKKFCMGDYVCNLYPKTKCGANPSMGVGSWVNG